MNFFSKVFSFFKNIFKERERVVKNESEKVVKAVAARNRAKRDGMPKNDPNRRD